MNSKTGLEKLVENILDGNCWLSGEAEALEGDPLAGLENREMLCKVNEVETVEELYEKLRNYAGTFKYGRLLFFNHPAYDCFVYHVDRPESYVEHLTVSILKLETLKQVVARLLDNF